MKAALICESLIKAITLRAITIGHVHSIFDNACNIEAGQRLITLLSPGRQMAPMSILLDCEELINFKKLELSRNLEICFTQDHINSKNGELHISLSEAEAWFPGVLQHSCVMQEEEVKRNIVRLEQSLNAVGRLYGMGPLISMLKEDLPELELAGISGCPPSEIYKLVRPRFLNFIQAVIKGDVEGISRAAEGVIGFGPGLTPSVDDFICGLMTSMLYLGYYYRLDISQMLQFNRTIISGKLNRTTRISCEMLWHASEGRVNQAGRDLILSILTSKSEGAVEEALTRVVSIGETSGSDVALGIYVGCKIMTNLKLRGEGFHGCLCRGTEGQLL